LKLKRGKKDYSFGDARGGGRSGRTPRRGERTDISAIKCSGGIVGGLIEK